MSSRTAVVIANQSGMFARLLEAASFQVLGTTDSVSSGERLITSTHPDAVIVENELNGEQGMDGLNRLKAVSPTSEYVLVVADGLVGLDPRKLSVYAILNRSRLVELPDMLSTLHVRLDERDRQGAQFTERRSSSSRRVSQDWSKVGWDQRRGDRRSSGAEPDD